MKPKPTLKTVNVQKMQRFNLLNPYLPQPYKILEFFRDTNDSFTLKVAMKTNQLPGQFVQVSMLGFGEAPISICSYSNEFIQLNIREVGNVTHSLSRLKEGDSIFIRGPYGRGYHVEQLKGKNITLIGGGCGVAPLKGLIDYIDKHRNQFKNVDLFIGYRSPSDVIFSREIGLWKEKYNVFLTFDNKTPSVPGTCYIEVGKVGFITDALNESGITGRHNAACICGPPVMMNRTIDILKQKGFSDDSIYLSTERLMYCAMGVCCHCMIHGKFTCLDGPVFRYDEIKNYKND